MLRRDLYYSFVLDAEQSRGWKATKDTLSVAIILHRYASGSWWHRSPSRATIYFPMRLLVSCLLSVVTWPTATVFICLGLDGNGSNDWFGFYSEDDEGTDRDTEKKKRKLSGQNEQCEVKRAYLTETSVES